MSLARTPLLRALRTLPSSSPQALSVRPMARAEAFSSRICLQCRLYSAEAPPAGNPTLRRLREDLKLAMRAKDTVRLNVLRNVLAQITNASKTNTPVNSDIALLALLQKQIKGSKGSVEEFRAANRPDLVEKEEAQIKVLEEYAAGVETVGEEEIKAAVQQVVNEIRAGNADAKVPTGEVMKRLFAPGGQLEGKPVQKGEIIKFLKALSQ